MSMRILQAGPLTTVQDAGRFGYLAYGIGTSGVMDTQAYEQLNTLLGNAKGEAVLEMTLMGPEIVFDEDVLMAYTGAQMQAVCDEKIPIERGRVYRILKGQKVRFGMAQNGVRAYVTIAGEIEVDHVMGSKSTNLKCGFGGFRGRKLQNGDIVPIRVRPVSDTEEKRLLQKTVSQPEYAKEKRIRVVLGPQDDMFLEEGIQTFLNTPYTVSSESDRMGIRLDGDRVPARSHTDIISDGIVTGSVQITSVGLPIVMMADHQTTGGYAKIATVIRDDLPLLAQTRPGEKIWFEKVTLEKIERKHFWSFKNVR